MQTQFGSVKLNLGCGKQPIPGFINVDCYAHSGVDEVADLNGPWPWADNSVDRIFTSHVVEHLDDVIHFMREAHRVLKVGGDVTIRVPYGWDNAAMVDPTHKRPLFPATFTLFAQNMIGPCDPRRFNLQEDESRWNFSFEMTGVTYTFRDWVKKLPFWKLYCFKLAEVFINVISQFEVQLVKRGTSTPTN